MATYRRVLVPGATYFFTVATEERRACLTDKPFYDALKAALRETRTAHPFTIDAFVLLPDHLHCIWTLPPGDDDYAMRWSMIKRLVSQQTRLLIPETRSQSRKQRGELGLWQRRFWEHQIRDEVDFAAHVDYIHLNPLKHGYVKQLADWPYSTFQRFVERGIYPRDWASASEGDKYGE